MKAQTFPNWEVVLVNDGGIPSAVTEVVGTVFCQDKRILQIDNVNVEGRWPAANTGVKAASGDFITLLDDDDTWCPEFLEKTWSFLNESSHAAYIAVAAERFEIQERLLPDGTLKFVSRSASSAPLPPVEVSLADLIAVRNVAVHSLLIRRKAFDSTGGYDVSLPVAADWLHNLRVAALGRIGVISEPLANYHRRVDLTDSPDANSVNSGLHSVYIPLIKDRVLNSSLAEEPWLLGLLFWQKDRFDELSNRVHASFGEVAQHVGQAGNAQVGQINATLSEYISALNKRFDQVEGMLNQLNVQVNGIDERLGRTESQMEEISQEIKILKVAERVWDFMMPFRKAVARIRRRTPD